jgi:predicted transcriptional regulator
MDIAAAILEIAQNGAIKTQIMYGALLSFPQMKEYLALLLGNGMLEHIEEEKTFHTTERGKHFIKRYREFDAMVPKANMLTKSTH